jgi:CBS domain-containing protein
MSVKRILEAKKIKLISCRPRDTIETVAEILTVNKIGALPVRDSEGKLIGIISERDIVRGFAEKGRAIGNQRVENLMTRDVAVCKPTDTLKTVMATMSRRHIRHLPVVENATLIGIISQRDVMAVRLEEAELETNVLRDRVIAQAGS